MKKVEITAKSYLPKIFIFFNILISCLSIWMLLNYFVISGIITLVVIWLGYLIILNDYKARKIVIDDGILTCTYRNIFGLKKIKTIRIIDYELASIREVYYNIRSYALFYYKRSFFYYALDFKSKDSSLELKLMPYNKESIIKLLDAISLYIKVESDLKSS